jgi:hypothetical protein
MLQTTSPKSMISQKSTPQHPKNILTREQKAGSSPEESLNSGALFSFCGFDKKSLA